MSGAVEGVALLPCPNPWCEGAEGVEASQHIVSGRWHICCDDCMIDGPWADSHGLAIAAWNTRTTPPARSYADGVEDAAQIVEHGYRCRTCDAVFIDTPSDIQGGHPDNGCTFPNWDRLTEESQIAAIRLLSQGGKA